MLRLFSLKSPVTSGGALVSESTGIERNPGTSQGRGSSEAGDRDGHRQEGGEICMMCGLLDCTACADTLRRRFTAPAADRRPVTFGISTLGARAEHGGRCECCMAPQPMQQSLDEMEFERSLCGAAARGDVARAVLLLQSRQADPNVADAYGYFPLHYAARQGHAGLCSNLLAANAAIGARAGEGMGTPLHRAVLSGSEKTVQVLLDAGADPSQVLRAPLWQGAFRYPSVSRKRARQVDAKGVDSIAMARNAGSYLAARLPAMLEERGWISVRGVYQRADKEIT